MSIKGQFRCMIIKTFSEIIIIAGMLQKKSAWTASNSYSYPDMNQMLIFFRIERPVPAAVLPYTCLQRTSRTRSASMRTGAQNRIHAILTLNDQAVQSVTTDLSICVFRLISDSCRAENNLFCNSPRLTSCSSPFDKEYIYE